MWGEMDDVEPAAEGKTSDNTRWKLALATGCLLKLG